MRRLQTLVRDRGFQLERTRSHGFVETGDGGYMLTVIDRGADMLQASARIGADLAAALKAEARRRAGAGEFFGHIAYLSVIAQAAALDLRSDITRPSRCVDQALRDQVPRRRRRLTRYVGRELGIGFSLTETI